MKGVACTVTAFFSKPRYSAPWHLRLLRNLLDAWQAEGPSNERKSTSEGRSSCRSGVRASTCRWFLPQFGKEINTTRTKCGRTAKNRGACRGSMLGFAAKRTLTRSTKHSTAFSSTTCMPNVGDVQAHVVLQEVRPRRRYLVEPALAVIAWLVVDSLSFADVVGGTSTREATAKKIVTCLHISKWVDRASAKNVWLRKLARRLRSASGGLGT